MIHWLIASFLSYNLIEGLPDIYISPQSEKIGCTWSNGEVHDKTLIKLFYDLLPKDKEFVAIDVGAQTGSFCLMAKFFPESEWYAFEPIEEAVDCLKDNLSFNEIWNVSVFSEAVSNSSECSYLKIPDIKNWGLATLGDDVLRFSFPFEVRTVRCVNIDAFALENRIQKVDFIKIDTEGWEYYILQGAKQTIQRDKPIILMEWNEVNLNQCKVKINEFEALLRELEYRWIFVTAEDILCTPISKY